MSPFPRRNRLPSPIISKYEILRGTNEESLKLISGWLDQFVVYYLYDQALEEVVRAYKKLADKGKLINELDVLIAGIVAANDETLITKDKDFLNFESTKIVVL